MAGGFGLQNTLENMDMEVDYAGGSNPVYVGYADPGSGHQETVWRIYKCTYSGSNVLTRKYANGSAAFDFRWDLRASYQY